MAAILLLKEFSQNVTKQLIKSSPQNSTKTPEELLFIPINKHTQKQKFEVPLVIEF